MNEQTQFFVLNLDTLPRSISGPYRLLELQKTMKEGKVSWTNLVFNPEGPVFWIRLYEMKELKEIMSSLPEPKKLEEYTQVCLDTISSEDPSQVKSVISSDELQIMPKNQKLKTDASLPPLVVPVYIQVSGSEFGPLSLQEFKSFLKKQQFKDTIYVWYTGLRAWFPLEDVVMPKDIQNETNMSLKSPRQGVSLFKVLQGREMRMSKRRELIATVFRVESNKSLKVLIGVCADISQTGIQVWLENEVSLKKDEEVELEIIPISTARIGILKFTAKMKWYDTKELRAGFQFIGNLNEHVAYQRLVEYLNSGPESK